MSNQLPDHHDAELVLKCYDLRREVTMRESRSAVAKYFPSSYEDLMAIVMNPEHPLNAAFRQVGSYWEMVYGMVKHGVVHPDFFMESNIEGLFLYAKIEPFLEQIRKDLNPMAFQNAEWVVKNTNTGKMAIERLKEYVKKMAEAAAAKAN
jgi:hypothetical protein